MPLRTQLSGRVLAYSVWALEFNLQNQKQRKKNQQCVLRGETGAKKKTVDRRDGEPEITGCDQATEQQCCPATGGTRSQWCLRPLSSSSWWTKRMRSSWYWNSQPNPSTRGIPEEGQLALRNLESGHPILTFWLIISVCRVGAPVPQGQTWRSAEVWMSYVLIGSALNTWSPADGVDWGC